MAKRRTPTPRKPKPPTYTFSRTSHAGIEERLALAALAFSKTKPSISTKGAFFHEVRYLSKKSGAWESRYTWIDNLDHIDLEFDGRIRAFIAHGIEKARQDAWENAHPSKELLAIVAAAQAKKAKAA